MMCSTRLYEMYSLDYMRSAHSMIYMYKGPVYGNFDVKQFCHYCSITAHQPITPNSLLSVAIHDQRRKRRRSPFSASRKRNRSIFGSSIGSTSKTKEPFLSEGYFDVNLAILRHQSLINHCSRFTSTFASTFSVITSSTFSVAISVVINSYTFVNPLFGIFSSVCFTFPSRTNFSIIALAFCAEIPYSFAISDAIILLPWDSDFVSMLVISSLLDWDCFR